VNLQALSQHITELEKTIEELKKELVSIGNLLAII